MIKINNTRPAFAEKPPLPLLSLTEKIKTPQELIDFITRDTPDTRCAVCHSNSCMMCRGPKFACGCFCPQCGGFMHLHCVSGWAEIQKDVPPGVLKCPVCSLLLKVPGTNYRIKVLKGRLQDFYDEKKRLKDSSDAENL